MRINCENKKRIKDENKTGYPVSYDYNEYC